MRLRIVWWIVYILAFAVWYAVSRNNVMLIPVAAGAVMLTVTLAQRSMRRKGLRGKKKKEIK